MFTLCIPTMDRFDNFLSKYLPLYINNVLISEIIISDENGNDVNKINEKFPNNPKIKLFTNKQRLGPFLNKLTACNKASNEWIVLMDSDNFADFNYFLIAREYIKNNIKDAKNVALAPCKANPNFNFSNLSGFIYKKGTIYQNNNKENQNKVGYSGSETLMNTGNYIINKYLIDNLKLINEQKNIPNSSSCDVIYFNTLLFEQLDLNLHVVPNLEYTHVVHNGSIYMQTCNQFRDFAHYVHERYRRIP
jgi:hypothetical protein